jgi:hypothetical protein
LSGTVAGKRRYARTNGIEKQWGHGRTAAVCHLRRQGRILQAMTSEQPSEKRPQPAVSKEAKGDAKDRPDWANGLKRLYDSVVEEELPDSFKDLLSQLDTKD